MTKLEMIDAKGFLFCVVKVQGSDRLKQMVTKYKKIQGLTIKVEKL